MKMAADEEHLAHPLGIENVQFLPKNHINQDHIGCGHIQDESSLGQDVISLESGVILDSKTLNMEDIYRTSMSDTGTDEQLQSEIQDMSTQIDTEYEDIYKTSMTDTGIDDELEHPEVQDESTKIDSAGDHTSQTNPTIKPFSFKGD